MNIENIFPTYLVWDVLDLDLDKLVGYAYRIKNTDSGRVVSNVGGWQSGYLNFDTPELHGLAEAIKKMTLAVDANYKMNERYYLDGLWININNNCDFNAPHIHPKAALSGVFYVKTPKDCGDLVFINPNKHLEHFDGEFVNAKNHTFTWASYTAKENYLYMFSPWLEHYVQPNRSNEDRISFAFNIRVIGNKDAGIK